MVKNETKIVSFKQFKGNALEKNVNSKIINFFLNLDNSNLKFFESKVSSQLKDTSNGCFQDTLRYFLFLKLKLTGRCL